MLALNEHYLELKQSYLFRMIDAKVDEYSKAHPQAHLLRLGIGDVTLPLAPAVISALHEGVENQSVTDKFHGYMPEVGADFLREKIVAFYKERGVELAKDEVFVSSGASDDLGDILDLFASGNKVLIVEPAYPAYVDANIIAGNEIVHLPASQDDDFAPWPDKNIEADLIYLCSPNNPTGAVYTREKLQAWVDWAQECNAVILFDAAYEAFIEDDIPHSIYEVDGAKNCAIEICSFSKTAGFTGTRCGYTIVPHQLERKTCSSNGAACDNASAHDAHSAQTTQSAQSTQANLNAMWTRNRTTKTNGVSYIIQCGAAAIFSSQGRKQIEQNIAVYKSNAKVLMDALDACNIWYCGGKNAPYIWLKCPNKMGSWELFDYLLDKAQIVGTPGEGFGKCGEGYFRLSMFGNVEDTKLAAARIRELFAN